jgi:hypothetical protein
MGAVDTRIPSRHTRWRSLSGHLAVVFGLVFGWGSEPLVSSNPPEGKLSEGLHSLLDLLSM